MRYLYGTVIIIIYLLKSDNTNSNQQHRLTELDEQGSDGAITAAHKDKFENKINAVNYTIWQNVQKQRRKLKVFGKPPDQL